MNRINANSRSCPCGTELERYIKSFIYDHTRENVELHVRKGVEIRHELRRGHTLLAAHWANVLQHDRNFPVSKHIYTHAHDEATNADVLILTLKEVQLMIYMRTGTLRIEGLYVFEWLVNNFSRHLDNYDPLFIDKWNSQYKDKGSCRIEKTSHNPKSPPRRPMGLKEHRSAAEEYLTLLTEKKTFTGGHKKRITDDSALMEAEITSLKQRTQDIWQGSSLDHQLSQLAPSGCLRDGFDYIYKLWRSLLAQWFNTAGTQVYLCTPNLDEKCLSDIIDLFLHFQINANITHFFTQRKSNDASAKNPNNFFRMKKGVLEKYPKRCQPLIEFRVCRTLRYPSVNFSTKFIAGVKDGKAQIMVTSADFTIDDFLSESKQFVSVSHMDETAFIDDFISPLLDNSITLN